MNKKKEAMSVIKSSAAEYLTYIAATGDQETGYEMRYENENIWLTQKMMAELYDVTISAVNQHIKKIFEDGELVKNSVIKKYLITADDGKTYLTNHYNLQMIIAVVRKGAIPRQPGSKKELDFKLPLCYHRIKEVRYDKRL